MSYADEQAKLRREAEADAKAARARVESQKKARAKQQEMLEQQKIKMTNQEIGRKETEIKSIESNIGRMDRAESRARRDLGMKRGATKRSDMKRIREKAGTVHRKSREEERLAQLKDELKSLKGASGQGGSMPRPPGGGLIH